MGKTYYETTLMPQTDGENIVINDNGQLDFGTNPTDRISIQLPMTINEREASVTNSTYIGGTGDYLLTVYCSDCQRFIKKQEINGNTYTVEFDDDITGETCILEILKKGV